VIFADALKHLKHPNMKLSAQAKGLLSHAEVAYGSCLRMHKTTPEKMKKCVKNDYNRIHVHKKESIEIVAAPTAGSIYWFIEQSVN